MTSERLEQLLRAERQARPEPGAEDRIWSAVEHRLSHGPPPPAGAEVAPGALGGATATALKIVAGLALIAAAVGVLARGAPESSPPAAVEPPVVASAAAFLEDVHEPAAGPPAGPPVLAVVPAAPAPIEPVPAELAKKRSRVRSGSGPEAEAPAQVESGPEDFAAELQLIAEIRGALKRGDSARALERVEAHARRFGARGQLVQERLAYQVEALCAAGRVADARRVAGDLLAKWPDSTHAPRVKSSCAGA